jgi:hypothetical protein
MVWETRPRDPRDTETSFARVESPKAREERIKRKRVAPDRIAVIAAALGVKGERREQDKD